PFINTLLVFLNGLLLPKSGWEDSIHALINTRNKTSSPYPALLCYDRYGQGDSDHDPRDPESSIKTGYGHDAVRVVKDLHQLLKQLSATKLGQHDVSRMRFIFVCNSIGCPIARLYARAYPRTVAGLLFLDSMIANTDFVSMFPDPDDAQFDPSTLPTGISVEQLRDTRAKYKAMFHPSVPNNERFDRRHLNQQLPHANTPKLVGPDGIGPRLTVVGHDWNEFAEQGLKGSLQIPKALTNAYVNPHWQQYNEGLLKLTEEDRVNKNIIIAKCCGHFIQKDGPDFVAREIGRLLDRL
ncbi:alpha/beta-hydrolase, partial [Saccharata proteae CBS 121410]